MTTPVKTPEPQRLKRPDESLFKRLTRQQHQRRNGDEQLLPGVIAKLPLQEQEVQKRCRQLEERRNELVRYQKLKISVYEDYKEALLTKKEYLEMKEDYEVSCRQLEEAIETMEREVSLLVKDNRLHSPWIERLKGSGNISELDRGLLAMTVEEIIVLDSEHIKVHLDRKSVV